MRNWSNKDVLTAAAQAAFLLNLSIQRKKISSSASPLSIERRPLPVLKFSACSGRGLHGPGGGVKPGRRPRQDMVNVSKNSNILGSSQLPGLSINYRRKHCETNIMVQNMRSVAEVVP